MIKSALQYKDNTKYVHKLNLTIITLRKWKTSFSRLFGKPRQQRTANDSVQKTDAHRQTT